MHRKLGVFVTTYLSYTLSESSVLAGIVNINSSGGYVVVILIGVLLAGGWTHGA